MDKIRVSAKTKDEAITQAIMKLGTTSDRLSYNVLVQGTNGLFGIGAKPWILEAYVREEPKDLEILENEIKSIVSGKENEDSKDKERESRDKDKGRNAKYNNVNNVNIDNIDNTDKIEKDLDKKNKNTDKNSDSNSELKQERIVEHSEAIQKTADKKANDNSLDVEYNKDYNKDYGSNKDSRNIRDSKDSRDYYNDSDNDIYSDFDDDFYFGSDKSDVDSDSLGRDRRRRGRREGRRDDRRSSRSRGSGSRRVRDSRYGRESRERDRRGGYKINNTFAEYEEDIENGGSIEYGDFGFSPEPGQVKKQMAFAEKKEKKEIIPLSEEEIKTAEACAEYFLMSVLDKMGMEAKLNISFNPSYNEFLISIEGEDMGILIGKRGQTLDSLQYLTSLVVNKEHKTGYIRIKLDTEDYRKRREQTLRNLARSISYKVKRSHRPFSLEPMNPYERRIIHSALQGDRYVTTRSEGEDPYRHVIIYMKENFRIHG